MNYFSPQMFELKIVNFFFVMCWKVCVNRLTDTCKLIMKTSQRTLFGKCSSRYRMKLQNRRIFIPTRDASVVVNGWVLHKTDVFALVPWFEIKCSRSLRSNGKVKRKTVWKTPFGFSHSSFVWRWTDMWWPQQRRRIRIACVFE